MPSPSAGSVAPERVELADRVSDMVEYLRERDWNGTIECAPAPGEEGVVLQHFLDQARRDGICVHAQSQHGWVMFHTHRGDHA